MRVRLGRQILTIDPETGGETAAELAAACGLDRLSIDGRPVPPACPLVVSGLLEGSALGDDEHAGATATDVAESDRWEVAVVAGPDSGARIEVAPGRYVLGRAPTATIAVADGHLEPHHALVTIPAGRQEPPGVTQLTGLTPIAVTNPVPGRTIVHAGRTRIELRPRWEERDPSGPPDDAAAGAAGSPWHRDHHRPVRPPPPDPAPPIDPPELRGDAAPSAIPATLLPALLGATGAVAMAVILRQPLILLFALSAVLVAAGTWTAQHVSARRSRRAADTALVARIAEFAAAVDVQAAADAMWHRDRATEIGTALARIERRSARLWERRPAHGDAWNVVLGRGERPWTARLSTTIDRRDAELDGVIARRVALHDVPVTAELAPGTVLGVAGGTAAGIVRSILVQLAANCGPADWELLVVADHPSAWEWTAWLPHGATVTAPSDATAAALGSGRDRHLVLVVDAAGALASRTSPLRRLIAGQPAPAVVVITPTAEALPSFCTSVVIDHDHGPARWFEDPNRAGLPVPVELTGITIGRAADAAAALAHRRDPEVDGVGGDTPSTVDALTLLGDAARDAEAIAAGWDRVGHDPPPVATVGEASDGRIEIDLSRDGPHTLIGGTTGAGKSELLRSLLLSLAVASPPELLSFVLVDYKGGAAFDACAALPHVAGLVTDLDDRLAARALLSLDAELHRREQLFRDVGASDLATYRSLTGGRDPLARLVVVVDEFATLATDLPGFLASLVAIAQRGRSLGVHLVLATQRPGAAINDDIRGNTNLRIALRVQDPAEALDVVGDRAPAAFRRTTPGRAMLRLGSDERLVFQVASTCGPTPSPRPRGLRVAFEGHPQPGDDPADAPTQLDTLVARIRGAAADRRRARPVWQPELPAVVTTDDLVAIAPGSATPCLGIVDDPAAQRRRPLRWDHRAGHLLVAGSLGSGTTTAAITAVRGLTARLPPEALHVYVLDGRGDDRLGALRALPHCAGVVSVGEPERLERVLRVLHDRTRRRPPRAPDVVVVIDGVPATRTAVDALGGDLHERLDEILADGPAVGVTAIATTDQAVLPMALTARAPQRWIMRLADTAGAALFDLPVTEALGVAAPPGRLVMLPERLEAQVVAPEVSAAWAPQPGAPAPALGVLPTELDATELWAGAELAGRTVLPIGLGATFLQPVTLELAPGDHVLVLGTGRSGRSTALVRLATAWHDAHPHDQIAVIAPRPSPLTPVASARGWRHLGDASEVPDTDDRLLLVVDDADLVDHPALAGRCCAPGVTVFAASRPDALRGQYGHWTQAVRRSRTGVVLGRTTEMDGDQLGVVLPRRWPVPHAAGRGWLVVEGACLGVVQLAIDAAPR